MPFDAAHPVTSALVWLVIQHLHFSCCAFSLAGYAARTCILNPPYHIASHQPIPCALDISASAVQQESRARAGNRARGLLLVRGIEAETADRFIFARRRGHRARVAPVASTGTDTLVGVIPVPGRSARRSRLREAVTHRARLTRTHPLRDEIPGLCFLAFLPPPRGERTGFSCGCATATLAPPPARLFDGSRCIVACNRGFNVAVLAHIRPVLSPGVASTPLTSLSPGTFSSSFCIGLPALHNHPVTLFYHRAPSALLAGAAVARPAFSPVCSFRRVSSRIPFAVRSHASAIYHPRPLALSLSPPPIPRLSTFAIAFRPNVPSSLCRPLFLLP